MKEEKVATELRKRIKWIKQDRDNLLAHHDFLPHEKEDLHDFNEAIMYLTWTHNYFTAPQDHI